MQPKRVHHQFSRTVDANYGQHTDALEHAVRGGARCGASCVDWSDRFFGAVRPVAAGRIGDEAYER